MPFILPVIMCGGAGTRMWPESRESLPKQFIRLFGDRSTFQDAVGLFANRAVFARPLVISNRDYRFQVAQQLKEISADADVVLEPMRRDSGPAVCVAAEIAFLQNPDAIAVVIAADHKVQDKAKLVSLFELAADVAREGRIVTLGVPPSFPATGYGYIRPGAAIGQGAFRVEAFVEKPNERLAREYMDQGFLWNSGNFIFPARVMKKEIARFEPEMSAAVAQAVGRAETISDSMFLDEEAFSRAPKKPIDYAVMERTACAAVIPADVGWSDIGTWSAVHELSPSDENGNVVKGRGVVHNAKNVLLRSEEHLTAVIGVDNVVVVTTTDAVLVVAASRANEVKDLVQRLQNENQPEASAHRRIYRQWGYYQSVEERGRYKVNRVIVKPNAGPSLKRHKHRAEHWVVVRGTAELTVDGATRLLHENQSAFVPVGSAHRIINPGKIDLELIEVQTGAYLGDDDAERLES